MDGWRRLESEEDGSEGKHTLAEGRPCVRIRLSTAVYQVQPANGETICAGLLSVVLPACVVRQINRIGHALSCDAGSARNTRRHLPVATMVCGYRACCCMYPFPLPVEITRVSQYSPPISLPMVCKFSSARGLRYLVYVF